MPRKRRRSRRGSIFKAGRIVAHVRKGIPYHRANSLRGITLAALRGFRWIDIDLQITKDGVIVCTHWPRPLLRDHFRDTAGRLALRQLISTMTWAEVQRLRAPGGYVISRIETVIAHAAKQGIGLKLEPKGDRRFRNQAVWNQIKATADRAGCRVSGYTLRANAGAVLYMRRSGIRTTILGR